MQQCQGEEEAEEGSQEAEEGTGDGGGGAQTSAPLLSIEYDPALLHADIDPCCSMISDVYTETVPVDKLCLMEEEGEQEVDPMQGFCDSLFQCILRASYSSCERQDTAAKLYPYFDATLTTHDGVVFPAHCIFLSRCPNASSLLRSPTVELPLGKVSLLKVLRLLYSTSCDWIEESQFSPEEYTGLIQIFGKGNSKLRSLQEHLETFVCSPLYSDARITSGMFKAPVHKVIICGRCEYFAKAFSPHFLSSRTGETELRDTGSSIITAFLDYLYTGKVDWAVSREIVVDMLMLANRIQDDALCEACSGVIGSHIDLENCCVLYNMSKELSRPELQWYCTRFILGHYHAVVSLPGYGRLLWAARKEFELMYDVLVLNPIGRGQGFGSIREVIGALTEAHVGMDERLREAKEAHAQRHSPVRGIQYSMMNLERQETRVKQLQQFIASTRSRYEKLSKSDL